MVSYVNKPGGAAGGDLGGTYPNPTVVASHLAAPLPIAQGGTNSVTQNWVDLTTDQTAAGNKTFSGTIKVGASSNPVTGDLNITGPGDHSLLAWAFDPAFASAASTPVSGTLYLMRLFVHSPITVTKIWWGQGNAAVTPVANQNFAGIYSAAGALLVSAGTDTQVAGSNGPTSVTIGSTALAVGSYWAGLLQNAATPQQFLRANPSFTSMVNVNVAGATLRAAINGTALTALPNPITPSAGTGTGAFGFWAAVS